MFLLMALYKVYYRLRFTDSARTMNLDSPTEGAAKEALVKQHRKSRERNQWEHMYHANAVGGNILPTGVGLFVISADIEYASHA